MKQFVLLTRTLITNTYRQKQKTKKSGLIKEGLAALLLIGVMGMFIWLFNDIMPAAGFVPLAQSLISLSMFLTLMIGLMTFPSMFYLSNDLQLLLALPLKKDTIAGAKFVQLYIALIISPLLFALPAAVSAVYTGTGNFVQVLLFLLQMLLSPVPVISLVGILFMLLIKAFPKLFTKDRIAMVTGLIAVIFAIYMSMMGNSVGQSFGEAAGAGEELVVQTGSAPFFLIWWTNSVDPNWLYFGLSLLADAVMAALFFIVARAVYIDGALSLMGTNVKKKKGKLKAGSWKSGSVFGALVTNELRSLFRSPAYLVNCILGSMIMPIIFTVVVFFSKGMQELKDILAVFDLHAIYADMPWQFAGYAAVAGLCLGYFLTGTNGICSSSISRMGIRGVHWMKTAPVAVSKQLLAMLTVGTTISWIGSLLMIIPAMMLVSLPVIVLLIYALCTLAASIVLNAFALLLDLARPKLVWDNETALIKNNMNTVITLAMDLLLIGVLFLPLILGFGQYLAVFDIAVSIVLVFISFWLLLHSGPKLLEKLS